MSEDKISIELVGARVAALTAEVRDLQVCFSALDQRFGAQKERMTKFPALLGRVAEHLDGTTAG